MATGHDYLIKYLDEIVIADSKRCLLGRLHEGYRTSPSSYNFKWLLRTSSIVLDYNVSNATRTG